MEKRASRYSSWASSKICMQRRNAVRASLSFVAAAATRARARSVCSLISMLVLICLSSEPSNLTRQIPAGLLEVLDARVWAFFLLRECFEARPPDVFHRVPQAKVHVLGDDDTLNTARMSSIVGRMIHRVRLCFRLFFST